MTPEEAFADLCAIVRRQRFDNSDKENDHLQADEVLTALLRHLGYSDVADAFDAIGKWYA